MIIDINNTIGKRKIRSEINVTSLIEAMDSAGIDMAVVFCFAPTMDNDSVADAINQYPDRLIGLYTVNPWLPGAEDDLKRALDADFKGLRLDAVRHGYPMNEVELLTPLLNVCRQRGVPIWAYGAAEVFSSPIMFQELAVEYPDVAFIMGHMGYSYEATSAMGVAQRNKNIYLDTTGNMFANILRVVSRVPVEQILLGTGTPDFGYFDLEVAKIKEATDNVEHQKLILGGNAARIFNIKP